MELVIRATLVYWMLWLLLRAAGKRSIGELTPLDLLVLVVIGDLVQQGVTQEDMSVVGALVVTSTFVLWTVVFDVVLHRRRSWAQFFEGAPVVLIEDGSPKEDRMAAERITLDDVRGAARQQGISSLDAVRYCVLETDGKLSFLTTGGRHEPPSDGTAAR